MGKRISQSLAEKRRQIFRDSHRTCLVPELVNGIWRLCLGPSVCAHAARGRLLDSHEHKGNYFPACEVRHNDHHMGWSHARNRYLVEESWRSFQLLFGEDMVLNSWEHEATVIMLSISYMMGEASEEKVHELMKGRAWWRPEMGREATLGGMIAYKASKIISVIPKKTFTKEVTTGIVSNVG